uniref:hypothetical protein n=1 Tax=Aeromonas salmonicida TaxID=645 RepID=UPI00215B3E97|nr:hypothetical protein [Aeromonas salmonicida]
MKPSSRVGDSSIMAMCIIYLLAGAFATVPRPPWVDATVALGLSLIPAGSCCRACSSSLRLLHRHGHLHGHYRRRGAGTLGVAQAAVSTPC